MNEWLDDTMEAILDGEGAGDIFEVGTGTGMILFNLGDALRNCIGHDPSKSAAELVIKTARAIPNFSDNANMHLGTARCFFLH